MEPKPRHLAADYGAQFSDPGVAAVYALRPPYPTAVFETLASLLGDGPRRVLELGCGTGDLTLPLAPHAGVIDALDPSAAMLQVARARTPAAANVRWLNATAEAFEPERRYALVVAAESLHWMDWARVLPMIGRALEPGGVLAIVTTRLLVGLPWVDDARALISRHSSESSAAFDAALRELVLAHAPSGVVTAAITTTVVWGRPQRP